MMTEISSLYRRETRNCNPHDRARYGQRSTLYSLWLDQTINNALRHSCIMGGRARLNARRPQDIL